MYKIRKIKKLVVLVSLLLVVLLVVIKVIPIVGTSTIIKDYGEPIEVRKGISVMSGLQNEVAEENLSEFTDEYGTDANIIIYDIGY